MDLEAYLDEQFSKADIGGAVLARQGGNIRFDGAFGLANRASRRPVTTRTTFQIASISKQFAAAAMLRLQEQGKLSLRDRIDRWLPGCPHGWELITLHHLLTHTSGIGHWDALASRGGSGDIRTTGELVRRIQRAPLRFPPGGGWLYSSLGYVLLARVVVRASGQSYAAFLQNSFFEPLEMTSTGVGKRAPFPERAATGYVSGEVVDDFDLDIAGIGTGDIWSTTADMARWDAALMDSRALTPSSIAAMTTPQAATTREVDGLSAISYGYGQFVTTLSKTGQRIIYHTGWNPGFRSVNIWSADVNLVVVVLANEERGIDPLAIGTAVASELV